MWVQTETGEHVMWHYSLFHQQRVISQLKKEKLRYPTKEFWFYFSVPKVYGFICETVVFVNSDSHSSSVGGGNAPQVVCRPPIKTRRRRRSRRRVSRLRHSLWPQIFSERDSGWRRHFGRRKAFHKTQKASNWARCCTLRTISKVSIGP